MKGIRLVFSLVKERKESAHEEIRRKYFSYSQQNDQNKSFYRTRCSFLPMSSTLTSSFKFFSSSCLPFTFLSFAIIVVFLMSDFLLRPQSSSSLSFISSFSPTFCTSFLSFAITASATDASEYSEQHSKKKEDSHSRNGIVGSSCSAEKNNDLSLPFLLEKSVFLVANEPVIDSARVVPLLTSLLEEGGVPLKRIFLLDEYLLKKVSAEEWTWMPWLMNVFDSVPSQIEWFFLATAHTRVNPPKLEEVLQKHYVSSSASKEAEQGGEVKDQESGKILGVVLQDNNLKITHHFFQHPQFGYPLVSSGVALNRQAVRRLKESLKTSPPSPSINIAPLHELFRYLFNKMSLTMTDVSEFCIDLDDLSPEMHSDISRGPPQYCATWTDYLNAPSFSAEKKTVQRKGDENINLSSSTSAEDKRQTAVVDGSDVVIAVKTTAKNYHTRIATIQRLWASKEKLPKGMELLFLGDKDDNELGIKDLNVGNSNNGHCSKFHAIMKYFYKHYPHRNFFMIVDDDTLVNVQELRKVLASTLEAPVPVRLKYTNSSQTTTTSVYPQNAKKLSPLYLGDRYGYGLSVPIPGAYDYISGGGGTVFDREALRIMLEDCTTCVCRKPDEPDDMAVGRWMRRNNIRAVHIEGFHQAKPEDYHLHVLAKQKIVTFHRFTSNFEETQKIFQLYLQDETFIEKEEFNSTNKGVPEQPEMKDEL